MSETTGQGGQQQQGSDSGAAAAAAATSTSQGAGLPSLGEKWYESLPDDLKAEPSFRTIHDIPSLAKSYLHAQKAVGADKVVLPTKHATEDDWKKFFHKAGLPEKIDEYKLETPKDANINPDFFKSAREQLYKNGVLPKQAQDLLTWYLGEEKQYAEKSQATTKTTFDKWQADLKTEWGQAYDQNLAQAKAAIGFVKDPELDKFLNETSAGKHPSVIKAFQKLGALLAEDDIIQPTGNNKMFTPDDAQRMANEILGNLEHPYHDTLHPNHGAAVKEVQGLFAMAYPDQKEA